MGDDHAPGSERLVSNQWLAIAGVAAFGSERVRRARLRVLELAILLLLLLGNIENATADKNVQIWGPGAGGRNLLGGKWGEFSSSSCQASAMAVPEVGRMPGDKAIRIHARQQGTKPCGVWMHLFNENASAKSPDIPGASAYLAFWVKGERGGEDFVIAMADMELFERDDAHLAGSIGKYLDVGVATQWQRVMVPVNDFGLKGPPVSLAILFKKIGEQLILIDDIELSEKPGIGDQPLKASPVMKRSKAMWVWSTAELLRHAVARNNMVAFAREQGVDQIFLQVLYTVGRDDQEQPTITISNQPALRIFLAEASNAGLKIHALDGDPEFVLRKNHPRVMALMQAILEFNRSVPAGERFCGIHLDNEPYLLIGFNGPQRDLILRQFIELSERAMRLLHESRQSLVFGVDIPFWFANIVATPENSDASGTGTESITDRILDVVDNVCIMDYRTTASGPDGIIEHARSTIYHANRVAKQVFIGVETFREQATPVHFLYGVTQDDWDALARNNAPLMFSSRVDGFPLRIFDDGVRHHVGVAARRQPPSRALKDVLTEIYSTYGATARGRQADLSSVMIHARDALTRSPEFSGFEPFVLGDNSPAAGFLTTERMIASTTFEGHSRIQMDKILDEVVDYFDRDPGFYGIAIDDYEHYRALRP